MFRRVIVGVDGGPTGRDAVAVGRLLAAPDGALSLAHVHVLTPVRGASNAYGVAQSAEAQALLEAERTAAGIDAELLPITASSVGRGLHYLAETNDADLLVVGSNPRSFVGRVLLGDATRAALIGAPCAVAVAPLGYADEARTVARIGVGYDGSSESAAALERAREVAAAHGAAISVLTVVEPVGLVRGIARSETDEELLADARADLAGLEGVDGDVVLGVAGEELAAFGSHVDLLVVGGRAYGPIRRLMMGSTALHLASNARCPLLVLARGGDAA
jgi:nucleotide-binding universal stress UspA family protein